MFEWKYPALWKTEIPCTILQNLYSTRHVAAPSGRFHDISMLFMRHRRGQSEHEDEGDFGKAQPALYPSVGRLHGQQTNMQVRTVK